MEIENGKKGGALHADGQHGFEDMEGPERAVRFLLPPSGMVTGLEEQVRLRLSGLKVVSGERREREGDGK